MRWMHALVVGLVGAAELFSVHDVYAQPALGEPPPPPPDATAPHVDATNLPSLGEPPPPPPGAVVSIVPAPAEPPAAPSVGVANVVSGRMPPEVIQSVVRDNFARFRLCYEDGLSRNPNLEGSASVRFVIGRDGLVSTATNDRSDLPDREVIKCVARTFYNLSFPKPQGDAVTVIYTIMFSVEGDANGAATPLPQGERKFVPPLPTEPQSDAFGERKWKRNSGGLIALGVVMTSIGPLVAIGGGVMVTGGEDGGLGVVLLGLALTGAGIPIIAAGAKKVPVDGTAATRSSVGLTRPTVLVGPTSASIKWMF